MKANLPGVLVQNVSVIYRNGKLALRDASFEIPLGTIAGLVGINGAGKSTLFKALTGFVPLKSGNISLLGLSVKKALKKNIISYVPQSEEIDWTFPVLVEDVVMMGRYGYMGFLKYPRKEDKRAVSEALHRVNLYSQKRCQIGELSGGQRKRVFLARALAQESEVILLDEPFSGVDVKTESSIISLLKDLRNDGKIMIVSTHNLGSVTEFCDRTIFVKETILAYGPTETTFTRENLELAFGGVLRHFVLGGSDLHDDDDARKLRVITDDERPFVVYEDEKEDSK